MYFDQSAENQIGKNSVERTPWSGRLKHGADQKLRDFQERGARFALERNHSYLAFEQGLGKTPTAITILCTVSLPTLIICPPFLVDNWKRELRLWLNRGTVGSIISGKQIDMNPRSDIIILPDTLLDRSLVHDYIKAQEFGLLIVDEAHRFKSWDAKRTKNLFEVIAPMIPKVVCLSGTPMPNRPMELYPVLSNLAHNLIDYMSHHDYGLKFCNGFKNDFTWDYSGASNVSQLGKQIMGEFMVRETKENVLSELKPKEERIILLSGKDQKQIRKFEKSWVQKYGEDQAAKKLLENENLGAIASYRRELGLAKLPNVVEYVNEILESTRESILLFAWHVGVIETLSMSFRDFNIGVINGKTPLPTRRLNIEAFQSGQTRMLIAQVQTMVGYNLTKASRCIFAEFSWSPSDNAQASDRAHRIGQKDSVIVDYLVLANSLDGNIIETLLRKQKQISNLLNKGDL
jgi:SWI/SNF-related matrix-associated actin-dependent regulator 1 of chromatin subfamily A